MHWIVEPGRFTIRVATSSADEGLKAELDVADDR
jgi:hypothetical protein